MRLKTYFSGSVNEAMAQARQELGPDALLVHSKRSSAENQSLGTYEVVFALQNSSIEQAKATVPTRAGNIAAADQKAGQPAGGTGELHAMREALEKAYRLVRRTEAMLNSQLRPPGPDAEVACALTESGFSRGFRARAIRELSGLRGDVPITRHALTHWLEAQLFVEASLTRREEGASIVALVGAPGVGKTATLVKLAIRHIVAPAKSGHIIAIEGDLVGGSEPLRCFAGILGLSITVAESPYQFRQALNENANKDIILIDTPGIGRNQETEIAYLSEFLAGTSGIERHIVLPADCGLPALRRQAERFASLQPSKLILTRLDEAGEALAGALEIAIALALPLSFCTTGPRIPEDIEPADPASYVERLLPDWLGIESTNQRSKQAAA